MRASIAPPPGGRDAAGGAGASRTTGSAGGLRSEPILPQLRLALTGCIVEHGGRLDIASAAHLLHMDVRDLEALVHSDAHFADAYGTPPAFSVHWRDGRPSSVDLRR